MFPIALSTILNVISVLGQSLFFNSNQYFPQSHMAHIQHPQMQGALDDIYCSTSIICQAKEVHQDSSLINMKLLQALSGNKAYNRNEEFKREDEIQNTAEPYHLFRNLAGIKTSKASQEDNTGAHVMKHKSNNGAKQKV